MQVTLIDKRNEQLTNAYIPFEFKSLPQCLVWDGKLFLRYSAEKYKEASFYSVPLATCTELPPAQHKTDGIDKYSQLDFRLQTEILLNQSALCFCIEILATATGKKSERIHQMLRDMAVEFVKTQTLTEIREWAEALDRAREKVDKTGISSITILPPDFGEEP